MAIENELKSLIINKSKSIRQFSSEVDIPATTIQSILNNGVENAGVKKMTKICNYLGLDIDALADGYIKEKTVSDIPMTVSEINHIKKYRTLDVYGKKQVDSVLSNEIERINEQNLEISEDIIPYMYAKTEYLTGLSAGTGLFVFDDVPTQVIEVPQKYKDADFVIGVTGNSMEPKLFDGDKVAVQKMNTINIGDIGVFMHDGNGYIKELGHDKLISLNKECSNIDINETTKCIGKVLGKI